jgi:signal transduction histidine kinase
VTLRKIIFFIFLLLIFFGSCTKEKSDDIPTSKLTDSIDTYLENAFDDNLSIEERYSNNSKAYQIVANLPNDSVTRVSHLRVAIRYFNLNKFEDFKNVSENVKKLSIEANDTFNSARAYTFLGDYYKKIVKSDSAYLYYNQAEKEYLKLKDNLSIGEMHLNKAEIQFNNRDFRGSENSAYIAMKFLRLGKDSYLEYQALSLIGMCLTELADYENAIDFHKKALAIADRKEIPAFFQRRASTLNNIGLVYKNKNEYKEAFKYFKLAFSEANLKSDDTALYAMVLDNLAHAKLMVNDFSDLPDSFYQALKIRDSLNVLTGIIVSKIHLSEYYNAVEKKDSALAYAVSAHNLALQVNSIGHQLLTLKQLGNVETEKSNYYSKQYVSLSDTLIKTERKVSEKFARIEFETDEFKRQKEQLTVQNRNIILFTLLAVFIVILLYIIRDQKSRNARFKLREAQQRANEEIYTMMLSQQKQLDDVVQKEKQRIGQELHDGVLGRLFGARLNLDSLNKKTDEQAIEGRNHYISELKNIEQDIREISHELNREKFALINNFVAILTNLLEEQRTLSEETELKYKIDSSVNWDKVKNGTKINIYRIVQESLQNINKYANAKNVSVNLIKDAENVHLMIIDDGVGFDVDKKSKGIGLQNITSRVTACQGTLEIKSKKGKGTSITIDIPIE